jgi:hypothetical protein
VLSAVDQLLDDLGRGADDVVADPAVMEGYRRDEAAPGVLDAGMPAGSGLSGGANAIDGCVVVCHPGKAI